jgi:hypothetical protein
MKLKTGLTISFLDFSNEMKSLQLPEKYSEVCKLEEITADHCLL